MDFKDARVLVTGGAGFVGSNLAQALLKEGAEVTVFDDFSTGSMLNVDDIIDNVIIARADVRDYQSVRNAIADQDFVFHLAANASVPISTQRPRYDFEVNALGTFNILESLRDLDSDAPLVFTSTAAVYGEPKSIPIAEGSQLKPLSPYGATKLASEVLYRTFHHVYGLKSVFPRLFNVYGPLQRKYVMFDVMNKLRKEPRKLEVLGTGNESRDFVYVSDAVDACILLARTPSAFGEAYNVGTGVGTTIRELVDLILQTLAFQYNTEVHYTNESWKGDLQNLVADITKLRMLGFRPKVSLKTGLKRFIDWYNKCSPR